VLGRWYLRASAAKFSLYSLLVSIDNRKRLHAAWHMDMACGLQLSNRIGDNVSRGIKCVNGSEPVNLHEERSVDHVAVGKDVFLTLHGTNLPLPCKHMLMYQRVGRCK